MAAASALHLAVYSSERGVCGGKRKGFFFNVENLYVIRNRLIHMFQHIPAPFDIAAAFCVPHVYARRHTHAHILHAKLLCGVAFN